MKKQILLATFTALISISTASAQGGFQRKTPEERTTIVHQKMDSVFKLETAKLALVDSVFMNFYRSSDKKMDELRAGGGPPDREAMMAARQKLMDERDAQLKGILTEDQMKKWKDEIEPSLRPQRGNRPPGQ